MAMIKQQCFDESNAAGSMNRSCSFLALVFLLNFQVAGVRARGRQLREEGLRGRAGVAGAARTVRQRGISRMKKQIRK